LKMLKDPERVQVHFASASDPRAAEIAMLNAFCAGVSDASRARVHDPQRPLPFGNLDWPGQGRKRHGISGAKEPRKAASLPAPSKTATPSPRAAATGTTPDHRTQRVTEADLRAGRMRIPIVGGTKALLPNAKANLTVTLRGREMEARYDPRRGRDGERSGILSFGIGAGLGGVIAPNEVLRVAVIDATTLDLT
jgi:hypothetical protein